MESLQQLSNESFSYDWLINIKPAFDPLADSGRRHSFDTQDGSSYIEMDPDFISMRWTSDGRNFDFTLPSSKPSLLVHADEIFSDGNILPLHHITPPESEPASGSLDSVLSRSLSLDSSKTLISQSNRYRSSPVFYTAQSTPFLISPGTPKSGSSKNLKLKLPFLGNCVRSPKKILSKYLFFLAPLYNKVKGLGSTARSGRGSVSTTPRTSNALSSIDWCRGSTMFDLGAENKIYDAVLHCKRSIGQH